MVLSKSPSFLLALKKMGIVTPLDVLRHLPRRYDDFSYTPFKPSHDDKERIVALGRIRGAVTRPLRFAHRSLSRFYFETVDGEVLSIEAWNRPYLSSILKPGELYTVAGTFDKKRHALTLLTLLKGKVDASHVLHPVYSLPSSIPNRWYCSLVKRVLEEEKNTIPEIIPLSLRTKYRLAPRYEAFRLAHEPASYQDVHKGLRVLKYEEALLFEIRNQQVRGANKALLKDRRREIDKPKLESFIHSLPFTLTTSQKVALEECLHDMDSPTVMYRLLQGDVGTGKTLVAAICAYANHLRSEQTALLAPTDALARQHYETLTTLFKGTHMEIGLLVGSLTLPERHAVLQDLADGTLDLVIGTHSLFSKGVEYAYLGLAIIDEQHKFGVNQRSLLLDKGEHADLLLMSATPIPRTLALTIYGDFDVSTLREFPSGKRHVITKILPNDDSQIQKIVVAALQSHHLIYVVAPQIEEGEKEAASAKKIYRHYTALYPNKVVLMHGKMDEDALLTASASFRNGTCPILVATSLIEVGLDVKKANTMIIYSPSHFALSSLHQLRGRIGRDGSEANCVLVDDGDEDEDGKEKLNILVSTDDGFRIAEEDLRLRGPGDVIGYRQSGLPEFAYANVVSDFKIFECARDDAVSVLHRQDDPENGPILDEATSLLSSFRLS